jgi:hypothetical protein
MTDEELIARIVEFRLLYENDKTNDFYLIQYLASVLDYIEREHTGFLTDLGRKSLSIDIGDIHKRMMECVERNIKIAQKDLVRFCLYMTNAYAVAVMFKGMSEVSLEPNSVFFENHPLPELIINDVKDLSLKSDDLIHQFKSIMDKYSQLLEGKYRTIYNEEKHKGFVKQIFSSYHIEKGSGMPKNLQDARECK